MTLIQLSYVDLGLCALIILLLAVISAWQRLGLEKTIIIAASRAFLQLSLVGLVLKFLFGVSNPAWLALWALFMLLVAGREVNSRQTYPLKGSYGFALSTLSMFCSSFLLSWAVLALVLQPDPWYQPQYAIPLLGMMLGNTMNGVSVALDRLSQGAMTQIDVIEQRLLLGQRWFEAIGDIRKEATKSGLIPIINGMATAGLVSLPGMMTGQILGGSPPEEAVKYQIMIFFMIAAGTGFGVFCATWFSARRMFDSRERLVPGRLLKLEGTSG